MVRLKRIWRAIFGPYHEPGDDPDGIYMLGHKGPYT